MPYNGMVMSPPTANRRSWAVHLLAALSLTALATALMLPRLHSAQFGFFDDPTALVTEQKLLAGQFHWQDDPTAGRFRSVYWLYNAALYAVGGLDPAWFFAGNLLLLILVALGIYRLVLAWGEAPWQAWLAGTLLLLCGPVVENAYTLSKQELLLVLWLELFILSLDLFRSESSHARLLAGLGLSSLLALFAMLTKESALILPGVMLAWAAAAWPLQRLKLPVQHTAWQRAWGFAAALAGVGLFFVLRSFYFSQSVLAQGYGAQFNLQWAHLSANLGAWVDWLKRDYLYLLLLMPIPLFMLARRRSLVHLQSALEALLWMAVWLGLYIPWLFNNEYYLLPFALGAAPLAVSLAGIHLDFWRSTGWKGKTAATAMLLTALALLLATLPGNWSNARLQLAMDAANDDLLQYAVRRLPQDSVLLVNIQEPNEWIIQVKIMLGEVLGRADLTVEAYQFQDFAAQGWQGRDVYVATAVIENQFFPSVRTGIYQANAQRWNEALAASVGGFSRPEYEAFHGFRTLIVKPLYVLCPLARPFGYCEYINSALEQQDFVYGWRVYRLQAGQP